MLINTHHYHANHHFCVQMFEFQHFRRSGGVKSSLSETFLGHSDVLCGRDILLFWYLSTLMANWLFILEYSLVLAAIYLVNLSLKRFHLSDLSGVRRNVLVYSRIILFFYFFRLNRTLRHLRLFINGYDVT